MELVAAVGVTNALRKRLPHTTWRKLHYLTLPAWLLASVHGVLAGTDAGDPWFAAIVAGTFAAVAIAAFTRFSGSVARA
jgi:sulfoxide reductase heme-binding subunit YedZ